MSGLEGIQGNITGGALLAFLVALGFVAGIFAGLFGIGGAFLVNPVLIVLVGINESLVIGSGLSFIIGTSAAGVVRHMRSGNVEHRGALTLGLGAVIGAYLGTLMHVGLKASLGEARFRTLVLFLYAGLLMLTAWLMYRDTPRSKGNRSLLERLPLPPHIDLPMANLTHVSAPGLTLVGVVIGLVTGMIGIGGGVLFVPLLILVVGLNAHLAVGTSLGVVLLGSISGAASHCLEGNVSLWLAMPLLVGSSIGVQLGGYVCDRLRAKRLRRWFAIVLLLAVVMVVCDIARHMTRPPAKAPKPPTAATSKAA